MDIQPQTPTRTQTQPSMKTKNIFFYLLLLTFLAACQRDEIGPSQSCNGIAMDNHPKATRYQQVIDKYVAKGLPGISILIRDEEGTWASGSGMADISQEIEMEPCMVSKAASITKTFMGVLTLKMVEEGKLNLDDQISLYLDEKVIEKVNNADQSTIRMLLNHTTGIFDVISDQAFYLQILNDPSHPWTPEELISFVYGDEAYFEAGTDIRYSNTNFLLLAMILDQVGSTNHADLLRTKVIEPLNLDRTFYYWHDEVPETTAQGYFDLYNNGSMLNMTNYNTGSGNGYGGIYANVFDLQTFIEELVRDKTVLLPKSLQEMLTWTAPQEGKFREHGLGIFRDFLERAEDEYAIGHRGRDLGYTADMFWFPEKDYTLVYLINYGTDAKSELQETFFQFRTEIVDAMME